MKNAFKEEWEDNELQNHPVYKQNYNFTHHEFEICLWNICATKTWILNFVNVLNFDVLNQREFLWKVVCCKIHREWI